MWKNYCFLSMLPFSPQSPQALLHLFSTFTRTTKHLPLPKPCPFSSCTTPLIHLLTLCTNLQTLQQTKQSHAFALLNVLLPQSVSLSASLILRYATFHDPSTCFRLFEDTICFSRSAFLWNTLIRAMSIARVDDGFRIYNRMVLNGVRPDEYTFPFVLKACADNLNVRKGMEVHAVVFKLGFDWDVFIGNTLLLFYGNCGRLRDVESVFVEMMERDVVSWNTVIGAYSINGFYMKALNLFCELNKSFGTRLNLVSIVSILPVCASLEDEATMRQIHCYVAKVGLDFEVTVGNALVDVYGKCRNEKASRQVFNEMTCRNEVTWNAIITSLAYLGHNNDAVMLFKTMINEGKQPNSVTISSIIPVLVELQLLDVGKEIHGFSLRLGMQSDVFVANSLIDMYGKLGYPFKATNVFHQMDEKNVVSWNAQIANFVQNKFELESIKLVRQMQFNGAIPNFVTFTNVLPACARLGLLCPGKEIHAKAIRTGCFSDLFVSNALTDMYAKCGCLSHARRIFNISLRDEVSYNILILGYCQTTDCSESLSLFLEMGIIGMNPDLVSYMGVISTCANLVAFKQGKELHGLLLKKHLHEHLFIANSLLDFYTKCGRIDIAIKIFDRITDKDAASWNTMILAYGMIGELNIAFNLFEAMKEDAVEYDSVSYIAVLSVCSHGGLVEKGKKYFELMEAQNIKPTQMHYACMVDLLGRAGHLNEAVKLIKRMPIEPDTNVWGALLGACRIHGNLDLACWAAEHLFELQPQHSGYYAILSNMHAEAGKWDEANRVRELMKSRGANKNPGCSWVQINDKVHTFIAG